jgi:hypothetical protein
MQMKQMELGAKQQGDNNSAMLAQRQAEQKAQIEQIQAQADVATTQRKAQMEADLAQQRFQLESELKTQEFALNLAMKRAELIAKLSMPEKDEFGNSMGPDQASIDKALSQLDDVTPMPSKRDDQHHADMMAVMQHNSQTMNQLAQALSQMAAHMAAPTELVRDPRTGKVIGSRKSMQ